jgi:hypothetical protein
VVSPIFCSEEYKPSDMSLCVIKSEKKAQYTAQYCISETETLFYIVPGRTLDIAPFLPVLASVHCNIFQVFSVRWLKGLVFLLGWADIEASFALSP